VRLWNRIDQYFKHNGLRWIERIAARQPMEPEDIVWAEVKNILIVRPHDQLGDFLLSSPAWHAVGRAFPEAHIGLVARSYAADAAKNHTYIDELLIFYENGPQWTIRGIIQFVRALKKRWDMAIVLASESHSLTSDLIAWFSGARYVVGSERFPFGGCSRNFFYNICVPDGGSHLHQVKRNAEIVEYLGIPVPDLSERINISEQEKQNTFKRYKEMYTQDPVVGIHIGANKKENRWPVEKLTETAAKVYNTYGTMPAVFWGPKEYDMAREFENTVSVPVQLIPPSSLRQQAVHFSLCTAVVCNDTGIMHLCAAAGTPLAAVFGPTDPALWKPPGEKFRAVRSADKKTASVETDAVFAALKELLDTYGQHTDKSNEYRITES